MQSFLGCHEADIRLAEGRTALEGRVEVCQNNMWNTVCDNQWGNDDARVVCTQLGFIATGNNSDASKKQIAINY